jgi:transposase
MDHPPSPDAAGVGRLTSTAALALLNEWRASGVSAARFARARGIPAQTLYRWRDRLRRRSAAGDLCQVVLDAPPRPSAPGADLVVELPGGVRVHVAPSTDERHLRLVLRALAC